MTTAHRVRELFNLNPDTGILTSRTKFPNRPIGKVITGMRIWVDGVTYETHRIIWLHYHGEWPKNLIDHKDHNRRNNALSNLRDATYTQNNQNRRFKGNYGLKGVCMTGSAANPWKAQIHIGTKQVHLGVFPTQEAAHAAYVEAAKEHYGEFYTDAGQQL